MALDLARLGLGVARPPFSLVAPGEHIEDVSWRPASDDHWASLRYRVPLPDLYDGAAATIKLWVNDWWPPPCPDLPLRDRGTVRWIPATAAIDAPVPPTFWVAGLDHHGTAGLTAHVLGTNVEVRLPDGVAPLDDRIAALLSRFEVIARGPPSWFERAYHVHRDIPDRGWGDGLVTGLDWAPWAAAPEHQDCPAPDLLAPARLPRGWRADATGARANPRLDHGERQWVVTAETTGDPLLWARAVPLATRHRHPLLVRVDSRYRLDWEETPVGWVGSLDARFGHHVVLLERGGLRIECWIGLSAHLDRRQAAVVADRLFL